MILFVIVFSFVKLIFARPTGYAHACTHAEAHMLQALMHACVCVWERFGVRAAVCLCVHCTAVHRWLGFYYVYSKQLQSSCKRLSWTTSTGKFFYWLKCLTQDCPAPYTTRSDLDNQHEQYFQILRTLSSGNMQSPASISQTPEVSQKESVISPKALKIEGAYLTWSKQPILTKILK